MSDQAAETTVPRAKVNKIVLGAAVALVVVAILGVVLVVRFVESERARDMQAWQVRLGIVADTRAADVSRWIEDQFATLRDLAENASLQLYVTELMLGGEEGLDGEPAELSYLRNLLLATAQRAGFTAPEAEIEIAANVERAGLAGIALTDVQGNLLVATPSMPPANAALRKAMVAAGEGEAALVDMYLGISQQPTMGFVVPVYAIQDDAEGSRAIGLVVGLKLIGADLYERLAQPGETAEALLVRVNDATIEYLSPLADGTQPLRRALARDTPDLAAAFVVETPGGFATRRDYQGTDVLVTGRGLAVAPWFLVRTVTAVEALSAIDSRARTLLIVFLGLIAGIAVALVAVWRHGTSLRAAEAAERHRLAAEQFANVTRFLRVVTDALPNPMMAVDGDGRYMFSNMAAAEEAGLHPRDMIGKDLASVMGPVRARLFQRINNRVMADQEPATEYHAFSDDGAEGAEGSEIAVKSDHLPIAATSRRPAGVLMRLEDITEITEQRRRGERIMRQLVQTLLGVVDRRDPYSANHSARLAEVAKAIAREMGLDDLECATVETAGNLINLGKILIPIELLTKTEDLTDEERDSLQNSVVVSADLLEGVEFDGPVVATIRQMQEHWDGTGPEAVAGEAIEGGARIVAVANAFVGMVSARAWRRAMPFDQACKVLSDQAGTVFDRRPVSALINFIDNRGGRDRWASWGEAPEEGAGDTTS
ncbi:MAG: PAS domain-containing protein [Alphaproteobacteria bacterium]|nr:PAS domain-containing protein [Alphaproteobacteria bacterium]